MQLLVCDECEDRIGVNVVRLSVPAGDGFLHYELCSKACAVVKLGGTPGRTLTAADFDAARELLRAQAGLDELAMAGAYDNELDIEAALPFTPPVGMSS